MNRIFMLFLLAGCFLFSLAMAKPSSHGGQIKIVVLPDAHQRIVHGAEQLQRALLGCGKKVSLVRGNCDKAADHTILVGRVKDGVVFEEAFKPQEAKKEAFTLSCEPQEKVVIAGVDESGALYGCLELAERLESGNGELPEELTFYDSPVILLRGPCIGLQRPGPIYDNVQYDYRYLPETFPWFYDKELWTEYLDLLAKHRSNTLYLWNGHPFTSILRLPKYPEAQEVETEQLEKNIELFNWLCNEADKRGIWVVQFFYNIHISHTLARHHGVGYTHTTPSDLTRDYTSHCITEFIKNYPNVGLMMCLGEALKGGHDAEWLADVIIPALKAGLKPGQANPPVIVRNHSTPIEEVLGKAGPLYDNIYTMAKYTAETLASDKITGGNSKHYQLNEWQLRQRLAGKFMLIANVHCVCNLEPFRWGSPAFVQHAMQSCDQVGVKGLHLYPLRYWDWPNTADKADPPLLQHERDWIWYATWARYAWNPYRDEKQERAFWVRQIGARYGSEQAGEHLYDVYDYSGDVMPRIVRAVSAECWNIEAHTMGQTLEQFFFSHPWYSGPEESVALYAKREAAGEKHRGDSPVVSTETIVKNSAMALKAALAAGPYVKKNKPEYERLVNDMRALSLIARFYKHKTAASISGLMFLDTTDVADLDRSVVELEKSVEIYRELAVATKDAYHDCASHHGPARLVPFPIDEGLVWSDVLHKFEEELAWVQRNAEIMRDNIASLQAGMKRYPVVQVSCPDENDLYRVEKGALVHTGPSSPQERDNDYHAKNEILAPTGSTPLERVSDDFVGLNSIRVPKHGPYKAEFTVDEPVRVFVGFALRGWTHWQKPYGDWEIPEGEGWKLYAPKAVDLMGQSCDVYYRDFPAGTSIMEFKHGAAIVVLGFTTQKVPVHPVAKRYYDWQMFICPMP